MSQAGPVDDPRVAWAQRNLDDPLSPDAPPRCLRCGETRVGEGEQCTRCGVVLRSADAAAHVAGPAGWLRELLRGCAYLPRGALELVTTPALWPAAAIPLLINLLAVVGVYLLCQWTVVPWLEQYDSLAELEGWTGWLWGPLAYLVVGLSWLAEHALPILLPLLSTWLVLAPPFSILYKLLVMPVMELLTEATEKRVLALSEGPPFDVGRFLYSLVIGAMDAVALTLLQGLLFLLLLPLHLVVAIGSLLWMVIPPAVFAGMDYTDLNLVRRGYTTRAKARLWREHSWRFFGYGLSFFVFLTIPLLNAVVIPAAAVGGALLYLELPRK